LKQNFVLLLLLLLYVRSLRNLIQQLLFVFLQRRRLHGAGGLPPPQQQRGSIEEKYLFGNLEGAAFAWVCGPQRRLRRLKEQAGARLVAAGGSRAHFRF
jgi:hypothetical protein